MKTQTSYTHYEKTIINSITLDAYDIESKDLYTDIKEVYKIFLSEYGHEIKRQRGNEIKAFSMWLQGLPSVLTVPFYNAEILQNALMAGFNLIGEGAEDDFLDMYWVNLSSAFFTLKENL